MWLGCWPLTWRLSTTYGGWKAKWLGGGASGLTLKPQSRRKGLGCGADWYRNIMHEVGPWCTRGWPCGSNNSAGAFITDYPAVSESAGTYTTYRSDLKFSRFNIRQYAPNLKREIIICQFAACRRRIFVQRNFVSGGTWGQAQQTRQNTGAGIPSVP